MILTFDAYLNVTHNVEPVDADSVLGCRASTPDGKLISSECVVYALTTVTLSTRRSAMRWSPFSVEITMPASDRKILDDFASRVRQWYPEARVWAFGSRVRGDDTTESDLGVFS